MITRRVMLSLLAGAAAIPAAQAASGSNPLRTAQNASDPLSKLSLSRQIRRLHQGYARENGLEGLFATIRKNLPQGIEQNFARLNNSDAQNLVDRLSEKELRGLAVSYNSAVANSGHRAILLELLALKLTGPALGRVSRQFGFQPVNDAIWRVAPSKAFEFERNSNPRFGPATERDVIGSRDQPASQPAVFNGGPTPRHWRLLKTQSSPSLNWTLNEIYLYYRTAPFGSATVTTALYETAVYSARHLGLAMSIGASIGIAINWSINTWYPDLGIRIGDKIGPYVDDFLRIVDPNRDWMQVGAWQQSGAHLFEVGYMIPYLRDSGGDDFVVGEWYNMNNGGCGSRPDGCPILE